MKNRKKYFVIGLIVFLLFMLVMTIVSRIINQKYIPIVQTTHAGSGTLVLDAMGKGVLLYGIPKELEGTGILKEPVYYIRGSFYEKDHGSNLSSGDEIKYTMNETESHGELIAKVYNYLTDNHDIFVKAIGNNYVVGSEVDFVMENNKIRYECIIPKEVLHEDIDKSYYLYVLEEKEGILGNYTIAVKTNVSVLAITDSGVGIKEQIDRNTKLIVHDTRLADKMRVRESE